MTGLQGQGALSVRTLTVDTQQHRVTGDTGIQYLCRDRVRVDGNMYALPMISVGRHRVCGDAADAGAGQADHARVRLWRERQGVRARDAFAHASGKTMFGFPHQNGRARIWPTNIAGRSGGTAGH